MDEQVKDPATEMTNKCYATASYFLL
jgi:hypothetical protein